MVDQTIHNISDTARWVAAYRAAESERPDALFRDPLAARVAGERGQAIASSMSPFMKRTQWAIVLRTKVIDELVVSALEAGSDRVLNLAAGLDTRPYRLPLPRSLTWIEADLPDMIEEKNGMLAAETPICKVIREKVDLADAQALSSLLERSLRGSEYPLIITEGLLMYLDDQAASRLARTLADKCKSALWIVDLCSPTVLRLMRRSLGKRLASAGEFKFAPSNGVGFFSPLGWKPVEVRSMFREALGAGRLPWWYRPYGIVPDPAPDNVGCWPWSAVAMFSRI